METLQEYFLILYLYEELIEKIETGNYKIPHEIILSREAISFLNGMMRYEPKTRLSVEQLSKQYFLTRDASTFKNVQLKKNEKSLAESIVLNSKEENSNIDNILVSVFPGIDMNDYSPEDTEDIKSFCGNVRGKTIKEDVKDIVGTELDNQKRDDAYKKAEQNNVQENINKTMSDYLHNHFDEMNKDCFYIEPLLIPTQPLDSYNSVDPISKFMDKL